MVPLFTVRPDGREPAPGSGAGKHLLRDACAGPLGRLLPTFCQEGPHICAASLPSSVAATPPSPRMRARRFACRYSPVYQFSSPFGTLSLCPGSSGDGSCEHLSSQLLALSRFHAFHFKDVSCQGRCSEVSMFSSFLISPFSKLVYSTSLHLLPPCLQAGQTYTDLQEKVKIIKDK